MNKLPQITLAFWIMKIAATTLGETAGDLLAQTMAVGYLLSSVILVGLFLASLVTQLRVRSFHPVLYWSVILSTSTAGTTVSDFMNRTAGLGYAKGALVLITALAVVFAVWKRSGHSFDVQSVGTLRGELLYWAAILISNTLGTSLGDFLADSSGLGYSGGALLVAGADRRRQVRRRDLRHPAVLDGVRPDPPAGRDRGGLPQQAGRQGRPRLRHGGFVGRPAGGPGGADRPHRAAAAEARDRRGGAEEPGGRLTVRARPRGRARTRHRQSRSLRTTDR
ncbi:COG4705 family protein [Streptomyces olivoreticuli]|uniref:COG4705 family protein n=1 Tax=Streptomyces olivoreticuli TaxID=68246 RepID=UPI003F5CC41B